MSPSRASSISPPPRYSTISTKVMSPSPLRFVSVLPTTPPSTSSSPLPTPPPTPPPTKPVPISNSHTHNQSLSSTPASSKPKLETLPPELLLNIVSYLPPSAFFPLSAVSTKLQTFMHTQLSSICNTRILTYHAYPASILSSDFKLNPLTGSSWLLPTHPAVLQAEEGIWDHEGSGSPHHGYVEDKLRLRISRPGPQFLLFLERRAWEVEARYEMECKEDGGGHMAWALERFCVRPFLEELSGASSPTPTTTLATPPIKCRPSFRHVVTRQKEKIKTKTLGVIRAIKPRKSQKPESATLSSKSTSLLFGEVTESIDEKSARWLEIEAHEKNNGLKAGLVWYFGVPGDGEIPLSKEVPGRKNISTSFKDKMEKTTSKMRRLGDSMRGWRCNGSCTSGVGSFESL
ncbi:hypothetical protein BJ875DRAFT_470194, partial [Amylocarpus encephaloides]